LLQQARNTIVSALDWMDSRLDDDTLVIGLEPSELLTFRDEALALLAEPAQIRFLHDHQYRFLLFDEFVSDHSASFYKNEARSDNTLNLAVHVHCHQKSLSDADKCISALQLFGNNNIETIASGCCGMAGLFGYQQSNYNLSRQIAELVLLPSIRKLPQDTRIVATGASCRQQIHDLLNIKAYHPAEILRQQLIKD
jgi:Fe-S oxidoreductase